MAPDDRAAAAWLKEHEGLIVDLLGKYLRRLGPEDTEDLRAAANEAALRALRDYQEGHESGATRSTLVGRYIRGMLANYRRLQKGDLAAQRAAERSLSEIVHTYDDGHEVELGDTLVAPDEWAALDTRLTLDSLAESDALPPRQAAALAARREGASITEIAERGGISHAGARHLLDRAKHSARRVLGEMP